MRNKPFNLSGGAPFSKSSFPREGWSSLEGKFWGLRFPIVLLVLLGSISCTMWEKPRKSWAGATGGEQLERQFWKDVSDQNWKELEKHLASSMTLTTPSGSYERAAAIDQWRSMALLDYSLGEVQSKLNGSDLVVSYVLNRAAAQGGSARPMRVMSVWQELGKGWVLIAQAHTEIPLTELNR